MKDDGYEPTRTLTHTNKLIDFYKVFAFFSYVGTPTSKLAVPLARDQSIPFVSPFTGASFLRNPKSNPHVVNLRASYNDETRVLVDYLLSQNKTKISVFKQFDSFGRAGHEGVSMALKDKEKEVHSVGRYKRNTVKVADGVTKIAMSKPDAIIMVCAYKPCAAAIKEFRKNPATKNAMIANLSFVGTDSLISEVGAFGNGTIISQVVPSPKYSNLKIVQEYRKAVKSIDPHFTYASFEGYLNAVALVESLKKAGPEVNRDLFLKSYENLDLDVGGIRLKFDKSKRQAMSKVYLTKIDKKSAKPYREIDLAN